MASRNPPRALDVVEPAGGRGVLPPKPAAPASTASPRLAVERLSDRLAALLAGQIDRGDLRPGDRLPTEHRLSEVHGVSRTVVREAVHQLKSRGLLSSRQGDGVFVTQPPANQPLSFDASVLESEAAVLQVAEVRRALEGEIAALAAERATRAQVAQMRRALKAIDAAVVAGRDGVDEDMALHRAIGQSTGNPHFNLLLQFLEQYLRDMIRVTRAHDAQHQRHVAAARVEHHAIVAAIAGRDPSAAREAATLHIRNAAARLRGEND